MPASNLLKPIVLRLHRLLSSRRDNLSVSAKVITRIQPTKGWGSLNLHELWDYRDLIYFLLWREVKGRYRQMALGPLWIILQPLLMVLINTVIFGIIARLPSDNLPYPVFNYAGVLPWSFFAAAVSRSTNSLVTEQHLISKVYFPRLVIPIVGVLAGLVDLAAGFGVLLLIMACFGIFPKVTILLVPGFLILEAATALGIGLWLASLTVKFRDVGFGVNYLLQLWMYTTPIVYAVSLVPERFRFWYYLNPMTTVIQGFRWALLGVEAPPLVPTLVSTCLVMIFLVTGALMFKRTERTIVDIV
ncbi:MAG: ABC transporter permease [Cyanobacteria bacterium]|nr:ABC transporter permease [Cyanobacteriota bacterium]MDW8202014.1 ABC transporter permease [Cyanobacteriota bacterium SKYGB_h_bin112]